MKTDLSRKAFEQAANYMPGAVNSPVRAFKAVGGDPLFIEKGEGAYLFDIDGNRFIDYLGSWGPLILGHCHPAVVKAVKEACDSGMSFGAPTVRETALASQIQKMVPSMEKMRLVNSGTEATMSAIRLARGYTGRDLILKFEGCYHGHGDSFLIAAGSGVATLGIPDSPGVTKGTAADTLTAVYNDIESVKAQFRKHKGSIAAVIVEPVAGNMGVIPPVEGFLEDLRRISSEEGTLLIMDEVMTGFRVARGGAQERFSIKPDISTFGKIVGGGMPLAVYGGRKEIMEHIAPAGSIYQAGTLSGNPLATAAGLATLQIIDSQDDFYLRLEEKSSALAEGISENCRKLGIKALINRVGSMMTLFFTDKDVIQNYEDARSCNSALYSNYFRRSLEQGIYLAPSAFESAFVSIEHSSQDIEETLRVNYETLRELC
jgi:glutamate-1-semialdehyde 2,1-aminomutase